MQIQVGLRSRLLSADANDPQQALLEVGVRLKYCWVSKDSSTCNSVNAQSKLL